MSARAARASQPDAELGDGVAHGVVIAVGAREQEQAVREGDVVPALAEERGELLGLLVHLDQEALRATAEVGERARVGDHAALDDDDRVADPLHLLEVVRRDDDVHPEFRADPADEVEHLRPLDGVEPSVGSSRRTSQDRARSRRRA